MPTAHLSQQIGDEPQWRLFSTMLAILVGMTTAAAVMLPDSPNELPPALRHLIDLVGSIPNIQAFAAKANSPTFMGAYLALGLILTTLCTTAFIVLRDRAERTTPFQSDDRKLLSVIGIAMLSILITSVWWYPGIPHKPIGLLEGRWGALAYLALSSRIGAATLGSAIFFVGPYMCISLLWISFQRPVLGAR